MLVLGAAIGLALLLSVVAFAADQVAHTGKVSRNVSVGGRNVSSASTGDLADVVQEVAQRYATTEVLVTDEEDTGFTTDAGSIGVRVDPGATAERTLAVGRSGSLPGRWWSWLGSFGSTRRSELALTVDRGAVDRLVTDKGAKGGNPPTEAAIQLDKKGKFVGVAGKAGKGIEAGRLADDLREAANRGTPIKVKARRGGLAPRFDKAEADALATRAEALVAKPLPLAAEGTTSSLSSDTLRSLLSSTPRARSARAAGRRGGRRRRRREGTQQSWHPAGRAHLQDRGRQGDHPGARRLRAALLRPRGRQDGGQRNPPAPRRARHPDRYRQAAEAVQRACRHPRCQGGGVLLRHQAPVLPAEGGEHPRMAELVRGQVIPPGGSFSVNGFVGERTIEKGFVIDKVIEEGRFTKDVGGGVSQFATTLFNAAWFAGLDFGEYQSHSLAISRYPKGREATLGFPNPDLVIKNPSPYGIMIWPTFTATEIRVTLYSTKWVEVKANGQDAQRNGACTIYLTKRQRTFLDGRVADDFTKAQYRDGEGQLCG